MVTIDSAGISNTGGARYRANCLPGSREPFKRHTVDQGPLQEQAGFLVSKSLTLTSAQVSTVGGIRHTDDNPQSLKKKSYTGTQP